jgi:hypothetical protein
MIFDAFDRRGVKLEVSSIYSREIKASESPGLSIDINYVWLVK